MRIAIIQFPGSNCERETMLAVQRAKMEPVEFLWNQSIEELKDFAGYIIVGGFSYEDRSRAGIIAALAPIMQVLKEQSALGKPILGICNGAQILVESGLVPGIEHNTPCIALTDNLRIQQGRVLGTGYYNASVHMRLTDQFQLNAFTRFLTPKTILPLPVAHGEGRFIIPPALLMEMKANGMNLFQYCDENGDLNDEFPINPNGSVDNIAAVSNKAGNVMAMMPHPERTEACDAIFHSMRDYIENCSPLIVSPLSYYPHPYEIKKYTPIGKEWVIDLLIVDNQALSVETALHQSQIPVKIKRYLHWEILCENNETLEAIKKSGILYNDRKESILEKPYKNNANYLVRAKDDVLGQQKLQMLTSHFGVDDVRAIYHGILWCIDGDAPSINETLNSLILFNPNSHDCYEY